jgi:hypothetical protein
MLFDRSIPHNNATSLQYFLRSGVSYYQNVEEMDPKSEGEMIATKIHHEIIGKKKKKP